MYIALYKDKDFSHLHLSLKSFWTTMYYDINERIYTCMYLSNFLELSHVILFFILNTGHASWSRFATQNCGGFGERAWSPIQPVTGSL